MELTVVIPAKNEAKYIGICLKFLERAIGKWGGDAEVVLVDNGSTDATKRIAEANGCRTIEQPDGKISKLRNVGARSARGNILAFLDADCLVAPDWISFCLEAFRNEMIAAVGTRAVPDFQTSTWVENAWYRLITGSERPDFVEWLGTSNLMIKKEVFFEVGGFDENFETGEDVHLCRRVRKRYQIFLEKRVNTIHLRESKTIAELFKREYWRGKSSLRSLIKSDFSLKEFPSIVIPGVNLLATPFFLIFGIIGSKFAIICGMFVFIFPALFMVRKKIRMELSIANLQCYIVAFVYIFARSCSLWREVYNLFRGGQS